MDGEELIRWREGAGLSQGEAAQFLGISRGTLRNYESGATPIKASVVERLSALPDGPLLSVKAELKGSVKGGEAAPVPSGVDAMEGLLAKLIDRLAKLEKRVDLLEARPEVEASETGGAAPKGKKIVKEPVSRGVLKGFDPITKERLYR